MSQKMGRPKSENPKGIRYSIRLDKITEEALRAYCRERNISKAEAIRQGIYLLIGEKNTSDTLL